jgi:hypothetical protein
MFLVVLTLGAVVHPLIARLNVLLVGIPPEIAMIRLHALMVRGQGAFLAPEWHLTYRASAKPASAVLGG